MKRIPLIALALALPLAAVACSVEPTSAFSSGGMSAMSDRFGVSGGGVRIEPGRPTLFYGTVLEQGRRTYTYLVIARNVSATARTSQQRMSGLSAADGQRVHSRNDLFLAGVGFEVAFSAEIEDQTLRERSLTIGGRTAAAGEWLFVFDAENASAGAVPVSVAMPDVPADFAELERFTLAYVDELIASEGPLRTFLDG